MAAKFKRFGELRGLEGMPARVPGWSAGCRTDMVRVLQAKRVATAAGDDGAINIWRSSDGVIRAEFMRRCVTLSSRQFENLADLRKWLREWWPKMGD